MTDHSGINAYVPPAGFGVTPPDEKKTSKATTKSKAAKAKGKEPDPAPSENTVPEATSGDTKEA